jgi:dinuclear metal center YbgI/SA1388 family protein
MHRDELLHWLETFLNPQAFRDRSLNGLQVEGREEIHRIGAAVDAAQAVFEKAQQAGVDFLIVHHGLFWGEPLPVVGPHRRRLALLLEAGINLYASHLPLDAHPEVGNNAVLARALGLEELAPFEGIGVQGRFPLPISLSEIAERLGQLTQMQCLVHQGGPGQVERVGIVSGAASELIPKAHAEGLELFITGEPRHAAFHPTFELGLNVIYAGHYDTETFGVRALAQKIEERFGLPWVFLDHPTGL